VILLIAVIDYGVGNLGSVEKAFKFIGSDVVVTSDEQIILNADAVVLPGVGAFADAMESLKNAGLVDTVKKAVKSNKPFLGICLGMQLLFDYSEEGGEKVKGLGIFKGAIKQLPVNMGLKVPHMGWNSIKTKADCPLFRNLPPEMFVYFVHSYYLETDDREIVIASTNYGIDFDVAVGRDKVFATQFHPEKSGEIGLDILRNFVGQMN
jgi:glutamine amidotransferase